MRGAVFSEKRFWMGHGCRERFVDLKRRGAFRLFRIIFGTVGAGRISASVDRKKTRRSRIKTA